MIIDTHVHLMSPKLLSQGYWDNWVSVSAALSGKSEEKVKKWLPGSWDDTGEQLISDMDQGGIDYSVISVIDYGLANYVGEASYDILKINEIYSSVAKKYQGRMIPFAGVDPRRKNAIKIIKTAVKDFRMKGIKITAAHAVFLSKRQEIVLPDL